MKGSNSVIFKAKQCYIISEKYYKFVSDEVDSLITLKKTLGGRLNTFKSKTVIEYGWKKIFMNLFEINLEIQCIDGKDLLYY